MKAYSVVALVLTMCVMAFTAPQKSYGDVLVSEIVSVYDGDTFRARIDSFPAILGDSIGIRVAGIDTPEIRGKSKKEKRLAKKAKQVALEILTNAEVIVLKNIKRGKYFRIVADVFVDGKSLADSLINKKLAYAYNGGTKKSWSRGLPKK